MSQSAIHYLKQYLGAASDDGLALDTLSEFAQVHVSTARRWQNGIQGPQGEVMLRVRVFLGMIGYDITELEQTGQPALVVSQAIALSLTTLGEVQENLGYAKPQTLCKVLNGSNRPMKTQAYRLEKFARESNEGVALALKAWQPRLEAIRQEIGFVVTELAGSVENAQRVSTPAADPRDSLLTRPTDGGSGACSPRAVLHVLYALEELLGDTGDQELVEYVKERASRKRLKVMLHFCTQR